MSDLYNTELDKKNKLKAMIKRLHQGENVENLKKEFKELLDKLAPNDIIQLEEELIQEGISREEIHKLCDLHLSLFQSSFGKETVQIEATSPISILKEEHNVIQIFAEELKTIANQMQSFDDYSLASKSIDKLIELSNKFKDSASHYLREENVLFPSLDKKGIKEPPKIMWMEHDMIRSLEKNLYSLIESRSDIAFKRFVSQLQEIAINLHETITSHFYKENNILFAMAQKVLSDDEMVEIKKEFDRLGYCSFTPIKNAEQQAMPTQVSKEQYVYPDDIKFNTGALNQHQLQAIFDTLPFELTFVDNNDVVKFFSLSKEPIFTRSKAVLGLKVQNCHPQKSIHLVNQIIEEFKSGKRDVAEFYLTINNKFIHIRYFAVRDNMRNYLGCIEVTQDITQIKKLEGEKRLL